MDIDGFERLIGVSSARLMSTILLFLQERLPVLIVKRSREVSCQCVRSSIKVEKPRNLSARQNGNGEEGVGHSRRS
jgi:hypothetical protein